MDETLFPKRKDRGTEGLDLFAPEPLCLICRASFRAPDSALCTACRDADRDDEPAAHPSEHGHAA